LPDPSLGVDQLREFYEHRYEPRPGADGRWRELGALTKAEHIVRLLAGAGSANPASVLDVGCGDGAVLAELARRGVGSTRVGLDISSSAVRLAASRPELAAAHAFDGERIEFEDRAYDLAFATHVLEHVPAPERLLAELLRVARVAIVEVPLESNLSARRPHARQLSRAAGHLQRFSRGEIRRLLTDAGWEPRGEILDPLPRAVHTFGADGPAATAKGSVKWALRAAVSALPVLAERLITLHYAVLAIPRSRAA
jgi:SAM-dependent methyltransferase